MAGIFSIERRQFMQMRRDSNKWKKKRAKQICRLGNKSLQFRVIGNKNNNKMLVPSCRSALRAMNCHQPPSIRSANSLTTTATSTRSSTALSSLQVMKCISLAVESSFHLSSSFIAAITSCTNTSNPSVMLGAGILARNAVARG